MKTLSLKVSEELEAKLTRAARRRKISKSALVREAIEKEVDREPAPLKGSVADLASDLIGCLEGPGDLSYNPKHMEGYGR